MGCREVLQSFSRSDTKMSTECNISHDHIHLDSLMHQRVAAQDALKMAHILDVERENMECSIEEQQAHRTQEAALSQSVQTYAEGGGAEERTCEGSVLC